MTELKAVLWDHDGTLVDTEPYWIEAELDLAAKFGAAWTEEDAVSVVGSPMAESARRMKLAGVRMEIPDIIDDLCARVVDSIEQKGIRWLPGVNDLFAEIAEAGIRCAIVSNAWRSVVEKTAAALPPGVIEFMLTGDEMKFAKPDPWPYRTAAEALGVPVENTIAIEDSVSGTLSAEAAGMAVLVVPSVAEVPDIPGRSRAASLADINLDTLRSIVAGDVLAVTP
ncbi:MAG TPA: HAD family phosphatase [Thermomicrobiales bacterium]|nr:HAD family phosphatase [Thermomicrobiales bacterium]